VTAIELIFGVDEMFLVAEGGERLFRYRGEDEAKFSMIPSYPYHYFKKESRWNYCTSVFLSSRKIYGNLQRKS